jgi:hypothetical protein
MQDWVDEVANMANPPCPCNGTQSCLTVTATDVRFKLTGEDGDDITALCYTLTPAMIAVLEDRGEFKDPQAAREPHTHIVKCTQGEDTTMRHGGQSYGGWATGGYLMGTATHAAVAADARTPSVLAALASTEIARQAAKAAAAGGGTAPDRPDMGVRSVLPGTGMPCGKLGNRTVTPCPPIEGMVCNGNPVTGRGRCVMSERDSWVHNGCLAEHTHDANACKVVKLLKTADGRTNVQDATDCSMRHADESLPAPEWRVGTGDGGGGGDDDDDGNGAGSCGNVLRPDEFLEFKFTWSDPAYPLKSEPETLRLTMHDDGILVIYKHIVKAGETAPAAPFEAVARAAHALDLKGIGGGRFVDEYSAYYIGRPGYHARLTPRALELVNGLGRVYYEILLPTDFDPARPVFLRFQESQKTQFDYIGDVRASLVVCGFSQDLDAGTASTPVCKVLVYDV